ncbi:rod shape-determining protein [Actinoplanes sp. NPDC051851]|uniref:rod shape-determining protein n=1 Tax=Actinoplanes sp. NPDC051851 TaxID=3154753 RepID=UPI0034384391
MIASIDRTTVSLPVPATAVAVDLGSSTTGVWASHHGVVSSFTSDDATRGHAVIHRGRVADVDGCISMLTQLVERYPQPLRAPDVVVACRPVLSTDADHALMRRVLDAAFTPRQVLFIDTVRAAAIGAGATAGSLLIADVGAEVTETALLEDGRLVAARRTDIGTRDLDRGATFGTLAQTVVEHLGELRATAPEAGLAEATARGLLLVGDGASHPGLPVSMAGTLGIRVHRAVTPRETALTGAGLAAASALRHPA